MARGWLVAPLTLGLLWLPAVPTGAQIVVQGAVGFNSFINLNDFPESGDMANAGDIFLQNDLELGGELYLDGVIYMQRQETAAPGGDQWIYFADQGVRNLRRFGFRDNDNVFYLDGSLELPGASVISNNVLGLQSEWVTMKFVVDADANQDAGQFAHRFTWYNNNTASGSRAMELTSTGPSPNLGNLTIAGSLTQNGFDIAEMFLVAAAARPGELVAVDASRPDAVRPAVAGDGGRILGVVATEPGIILGGGAFSLDALRHQWGDEFADEFEGIRPVLEAELYAESPGLRDQAASLVSAGAFAEALEKRSDAPPRTVADRPDAGEGSRATVPPSAPLDEVELRREYAEALVQHETELFDAALARFSEHRLARVALAGRVPVRVDASFGPIEAGDPLTASPVPGVAMKARGAGWIVGTALEAMPSGAGTVLAFVDRDWFGGAESGRLAELEAELDGLKSALAALSFQRRELRASVASRSQAGGAE